MKKPVDGSSRGEKGSASTMNARFTHQIPRGAGSASRGGKLATVGGITPARIINKTVRGRESWRRSRDGWRGKGGEARLADSREGEKSEAGVMTLLRGNESTPPRISAPGFSSKGRVYFRPAGADIVTGSSLAFGG